MGDRHQEMQWAIAPSWERESPYTASNGAVEKQLTGKKPQRSSLPCGDSRSLEYYRLTINPSCSHQFARFSSSPFVIFWASLLPLFLDSGDPQEDYAWKHAKLPDARMKSLKDLKAVKHQLSDSAHWSKSQRAKIHWLAKKQQLRDPCRIGGTAKGFGFRYLHEVTVALIRTCCSWHRTPVR